MPSNRTQGSVRSIPENVEETRTIPFILSTYTRDRHKTVLNQANWKLDNYRKNPVVGYMHDLYGNSFSGSDPDMILGAGKNITTEGYGKNEMLVGSAKFDPREVNLLAEKVFRKLILGSLRAVSVGFTEIGTGKWGTENEAKGMEKETYYFAGQELLEFSIVPIGSNPEAGKRSSQSMKTQGRAAIVYAMSELGQKFTLKQIEELTVGQVLTLLNAKDLGLKGTDPLKLQRLLNDKNAERDQIRIIENQREAFRMASRVMPSPKTEKDYVTFSKILRSLN